MIRLLLLTLALTGPWAANPTHARTADFRTTSRDFPIEILSLDPALGQDALAALERAFRTFAQRTGCTTLEPARFRFVLRDSSRTGPADEAASYPRRVTLNPFPLFTSSNSGWGYHEETLIRTAMIMQVEAYALMEARGVVPGDTLPDPPLWLIEGLTQAALPDKRHHLERIIHRLGQTGRAASLATLQQWSELSDHRLEQYWQQAQCYWAVERASRTAADRERLRLWMDKWLLPKVDPFWSPTPDSESWWQETLLTARPKPPIPIISPADTASQIKQISSFRARPVGETKSANFTLRNLPASPSDFADPKDLQQLAIDLLKLQSTTNFLWKDVIEAYRAAFSAWLSGRYVDYLRLLTQAEREQATIETFLEAVRTHLDWFEVNHTLGGPRPSILSNARRVGTP
ncbi:MAG: hypothetical protein SNJ84_10405, partial [Verrucomicrobiia bacterium]